MEDNYKHFYGQGGEAAAGQCPLWSDNTNLHRDEVLRAVEAAKKKIDVKNLKHDPSKHMERPLLGFHRNVLGPAGEEDEDEEDDEDEDDDDNFLDDEDEDDEGWGGYRFGDWDEEEEW